MRVLLASLRRRRARPRRQGASPGPYPNEAYLADAYYSDVVAFRGAMGYGANTTGGRGNGTNGDTTLYFVDNLNDSGAGSLRAALEATGKRVIVPRVGGFVDLESRISVNNPDGHQNFTFLGQLAPGGGLAVRHASLPAADNFTPIVWRANNAIVRHLRIRAGEGTNIDGLGLWGEATVGSSNMVFDHISASWATDESVQFWGGLTNITLQNCLIGEALDWSGHPLGILLGPYQTQRTSVLYSLFMSGKTRYPYYKNGPLNQYIGNVVYNSRDDFMVYVGDEASLSTHTPSLDAINNTWLNGPLTDTTYNTLRLRNQGQNSSLRGSVYLRGNKTREITNEADLNEQWAMAMIVDSAMSGTLADWRADTPHGTPAVYERTREDALAHVFAKAGASLPRDSTDARFISEATNNTGPSGYPLTVAAAGGYPTIASGTYPTAADGVISDAWRTANGETRAWYELDTGGTGRMIVENYADDVADGIWVEP